MFDKIRNKGGSASVDWVERAAVGASFVCLIHCLALPFLLAALPTLASAFPVPETFHIWVIAFAVPTSMIALWSGRSRHGSTSPLVAGILGLILIAFGALVWGGTAWETPITVLGSLALAGAHLGNWRLRHAHAHAAH
ncbi:MerC domain-containing protein [Sphingomonas sp. UYP23]